MFSATVVASVVAITSAARAQATAPSPATAKPPASAAASRAPSELRISLPVDIAVTAVGAATWLVSDLLKSHLAPLACRWCEANALDTAARDHLRWTDHGGAAVTLSNVGAYAAAPLVSAGLLAVAAAEQGDARRIGIDLLLTAEAVTLAANLDQLVKYTVGRQRPYAHAGVPNPDTRQGADDVNLSFYSAHTSITFSIAAAAGTVARLRRSRWAPAIYIAGAAVGAATAYLRIAADQHYLTDVVTGAAVGSAVGVGVPLLHRPRDRSTATSLVVEPLTIAGSHGLGCTVLW